MSLNMNWIIDEVLAIGPYPCQSDIEYLHQQGFRAIVRFTEETQSAYTLPEEWIDSLHLPIADYGLPRVEQVGQLVRHMHFYLQQGIKVYLHCRAGYGRAGTMAALYLVSTGESPQRAIRILRSRRPGTIETEAQQAMILGSDEWMKALMNEDDMQWFKSCKMIEILRRKCPWDQAQTHETLIESLMDEAYEVVEAIRSRDILQLKEELGDLMIQPLIQAQIAKEQGHFSINDALEVMLVKLNRRHPHVFGATVQHTPREVVHQWSDIKKQEHAEKTPYPSPLKEIMDISMEASADGFEWEKAEDVLDKIGEELEETRQAFSDGDQRSIENELGDLLFAVFNAIRYLKTDPIKVMERGRRKFEIRYRTAQRMMQEDGLTPGKLSTVELNNYWDRAKKFNSPF
jgi:tetrapyrrole methylase family protein / MazG family protein